jgi:TetR/AcrR family transcriptional regulator, regulator of cefoperazone and chloramphenicol sensitivity
VIDHEDLTGRARVRNAAIVLFGERGFEGATIRDIAQLAGVSSGLVRHHFGSKEDVRNVCDDYVVERLMSVKEDVVWGGRLADAAFLSGIQPELLTLYRYLGRSIADGSPAADVMFTHLLALGERWLAEHGSSEIADLRALACVLVAAQLGVLAMRRQISHALEVDLLSPDGHLRIAHALIDFYSTPLLSSNSASAGHRAIDELQHRADIK